MQAHSCLPHSDTHICTHLHPIPYPTWFKVLKNFTKLGHDCLTKINHWRSATASWWFIYGGDLAAQRWHWMECFGTNKSYNTNLSCISGNITIPRERRRCLSQGRAVESPPWKKKEVAKTALQTQLAGKLTTKKKSSSVWELKLCSAIWELVPITVLHKAYDLSFQQITMMVDMKVYPCLCLHIMLADCMLYWNVITLN